MLGDVIVEYFHDDPLECYRFRFQAMMIAVKMPHSVTKVVLSQSSGASKFGCIHKPTDKQV